ncbi:MAG: hypothetical protein ACQETE_04255 [Bacteroidota bacterium]
MQLERVLPFVVLTILIITATSCTDNPQSIESDSKLTENTSAQQFNTESVKGIIPFDFVVDWKSGIKGFSKTLNKAYTEYQVRPKYPFPKRDKNRQNIVETDYRIISISTPKSGKYEFYVLKYKYPKTKNQSSLTWSGLDKYSGNIYLYDKDGKEVHTAKYEEGEFITNINRISPEQYEDTKNKLTVRCRTEITYNLTDWFQSVNGGETEYLSTTLESISYEQTCHSSYSPNEEVTYYNFNSKITNNSDIMYGDGFEYSKVKCVLDRLRFRSKTFDNDLDKFDGENPVSHILFKIDSSLDPGDAAVTSAPSNTNEEDNYIITIRFNSNFNYDASYHNRNNLEIALSIVHEVIHAEFYRKLMSVAGTDDLDDVSKQDIFNALGDYPGMVDYMSRYKDWQHNQMAAHYINKMSFYLSEFDNYNKSDQYYEDISWAGMREMDIQAWNELSSEEKQRIDSHLQDLADDNSYDQCLD